MATPEPISYDLEATVDEHLTEELVQHGVPRDRRVRIHLEVVADDPDRTVDRRDGWLSFFGMIDSGDPDLAEKSEDILRQELGRE